MDDPTRADMQQWTGCIAGALTRHEFEEALSAAGLTDIEIRETHRANRIPPRRRSAGRTKHRRAAGGVTTAGG